MVIFALTSSSSKLKQHIHQSFSESLMEDSIEDAETIIHRWISPQLLDSSSSSFCCISSLFSTGNREEARRFIDAVNSLHSGMVMLVSVNPTSMKLVRAENLMRISMNHLSNEFYRILKWNRRYLDPESVSLRSRISSRNVSDEDAMADLKMIADCMTSSGYGRECFRIYQRIRKSIIVEALDRLGFENLSLSQIQKLEWEIMEKKIRKWLRVVTRATTTLFYGEKTLSDHVFSSSSAAIRESSFAEITMQSALALFSFPGNMAKSPEKIFLTLDVYQTIIELLPKIEQVFCYDSTSSVRSQVAVTLTNLGEGVISMIDEFESSISKESSKSLISGGGIHQLTRYVMNFIVFLADYSDTLSDIIPKSSLPLPGDPKNSSGDANSSSPIATRISWLILFLLCKIDAKSRLYNDVALSYLFLINNLHYVVVKVRSSNLKEILSEDWLKNHEAKVKKYAAKFEEIVWGEMMTSLPATEKLWEEEEAEEFISRFSDRFEEAYRRQTGWVVPDPKLRDEIKLSVAMMLIPSYSEFYKKYRVGLRENVGFAPEDIGNYLSDLYFGSGGSGIASSIHSSDSYI